MVPFDCLRRANGGCVIASLFSIAPWVPYAPNPPQSARITTGDFDGDGRPSQVFEFTGGWIEQQIGLRQGAVYFVCANVGWKRLRTAMIFELAAPNGSGFQTAVLGGASTSTRLSASFFERHKACYAVQVTTAATGGGEVVRLLATSAMDNSATADDIDVREMRPDSLRVLEATFEDRPTNMFHEVLFRVWAGTGNPVVLLVSPRTANLTVPGLSGELLIDPTVAITVDVAVNPVGPEVPVGLNLPESAFPRRLPALYWQAFALDVSASVVRAADVAVAWSYQR